MLRLAPLRWPGSGDVYCAVVPLCVVALLSWWLSWRSRFLVAIAGGLWLSPGKGRLFRGRRGCRHGSIEPCRVGCWVDVGSMLSFWGFIRLGIVWLRGVGWLWGFGMRLSACCFDRGFTVRCVVPAIMVDTGCGRIVVAVSGCGFVWLWLCSGVAVWGGCRGSCADC